MPHHFFNANNFQILRYTWRKKIYSLFIKSNSNDFLQLNERFKKLAICLSQTSKIRILDDIGDHFADKLAKSVKPGQSLRGRGDNWDISVMSSHIREGILNKSMYLFTSSIIVNRLSFSHLDNTSPKCSITIIDRECFFPNLNELKTLRENFKIFVGRICVQFLTKFKFLKSVVTQSIFKVSHKFSKEIAERSTIVSLPILNCNEINQHDCVTILRTYEKWIFEIHQKAGLINHFLQNPNLSNPPVCNPGEPGANVLSTNNDPMYYMKIPFAGEQLTRVRFTGAKDLLAGANPPTNRFEHCSPFKPVMFQTKASFLQYCYSALYHPEGS